MVRLHFEDGTSIGVAHASPLVGVRHGRERWHRREPTAPNPKQLPALLDRSLLDIEMSVRTTNALLYPKGRATRPILTLGELSSYGEQCLLRRRGFGLACLEEVKEVLADYGLRLGMMHENREETP